MSRFQGVPAPPEGVNSRYDYFQNYRNETMSRFMMPLSTDWEVFYTPTSYTLHKPQDMNKYLNFPKPQFSMLDAGRQQEIDDFYLSCQEHRDQYKDRTGNLHPLNYFKFMRYKFQCPTDPTTAYLHCPRHYIKYKSPEVGPLTLGRSYKAPMLPARALTGRFDPSSITTYKR